MPAKSPLPTKLTSATGNIFRPYKSDSWIGGMLQACMIVPPLVIPVEVYFSAYKTSTFEDASNKRSSTQLATETGFIRGMQLSKNT